MERVGVLGCGLMGSGIAQVSAAAGYRVVVRESSEELLRKGLMRIEGFLATGVRRGKLDEARKGETLARIHGTTQLNDFAACDLIIEAIPENLTLKQAAFRELDAVAKPEAVLASNTSVLCILELAMVTKRPEKVLGLHFFYPVPLMHLVEVIRSLVTSEATFQCAADFAATLGKEAVATVDKPGFVVNRLLSPYLMDAVRALEEGIGTIADIDKAMRLGCGYPMGPFTLLDFVGLDSALHAAEALYKEFRSPRFAPPTLLRRMVRAGFLGRKSGKGFYTYSEA
ncbi:MAG: 3-hydroxybutyryl-CoA dehydrogenase [Candidatus Tectomicrobia bacterium]|nr:3-hydroxybutyryl-CoA dehydrogenase [Candidatus Tectomicrobia bacterium]